MTWSAETLAKVKRLQAAYRGPDIGLASLRALNKTTLAEKAKMSPEAIEAEEQSRRNHRFNPDGSPR